jgi:phosphogluconate dehydratase
MSGASGAVPAAIHVTPECLTGGPLAKLRDGDVVRLDSLAGTLDAHVSAAVWDQRSNADADVSGNAFGVGRELFKLFRANAAAAEQGGGVCLP